MTGVVESYSDGVISSLDQQNVVCLVFFFAAKIPVVNCGQREEHWGTLISFRYHFNTKIMYSPLFHHNISFIHCETK